MLRHVLQLFYLQLLVNIASEVFQRYFRLEIVLGRTKLGVCSTHVSLSQDIDHVIDPLLCFTPDLQFMNVFLADLHIKKCYIWFIDTFETVSKKKMSNLFGKEKHSIDSTLSIYWSSANIVLELKGHTAKENDCFWCYRQISSSKKRRLKKKQWMS